MKEGEISRRQMSGSVMGRDQLGNGEIRQRWSMVRCSAKLSFDVRLPRKHSCRQDRPLCSPKIDDVILGKQPIYYDPYHAVSSERWSDFVRENPDFRTPKRPKFSRRQGIWITQIKMAEVLRLLTYTTWNSGHKNHLRKVRLKRKENDRIFWKFSSNCYWKLERSLSETTSDLGRLFRMSNIALPVLTWQSHSEIPLPLKRSRVFPMYTRQSGVKK